MLARLALSPRPDQTAQVRLQAADGTWTLVRAAPLAGPHLGGGYAITLQAAPPTDLISALMPAWNLSPRERDVAALIIDGRSSGEIAATLFLSPHTARDHTKNIYAKVGVHNRRDLTAALTGQPGARPSEHMPMPHWDWQTAAGPPGSRVSAPAPPQQDDEPPPALPAVGEPVRYGQHIKALFRRLDRQSMQFAFDLWSHQDVSQHADAILARLRAGAMPCDGVWPDAQIEVFQRWIDAGTPA